MFCEVKRTYSRDADLGNVTGCFVSTACCDRWEVKDSGGNKEGHLDDEEDDDDDDDELVDEHDEDEDVSDSESSSSEGGVVVFRFMDGNTVGSRTDRPGNEGL